MKKIGGYKGSKERKKEGRVENLERSERQCSDDK